MTKTMAFYPRTAQRRGASIVKHLEGHKDKPYEVIYDTKVRGEISWAFFATRKQADAFVSEVR